MIATMASAISIVFCVIFLLMMLDKSVDTEKHRQTVFYFYLVGLVIIPMVVFGLGIFGIGFDYVKSICKEIEDYKA